MGHTVAMRNIEICRVQPVNCLLVVKALTSWTALLARLSCFSILHATERVHSTHRSLVGSLPHPTPPYQDLTCEFVSSLRNQMNSTSWSVSVFLNDMTKQQKQQQTNKQTNKQAQRNKLKQRRYIVVTNGIRSTPELDVLAPFCIWGVWP